MQTSLDSLSINALHVDSTGAVWIGSRAGLGRLGPESEEIVSYDIRPTGPRIISVLSIAETADGSLWLGTSATLARFDRSSGAIEHLWPDNESPAGLHGSQFQATIVDRDGFVWTATRDAGVNRLDPTTLTVRHYRHDPADVNSLSDDDVVDLYEHPDGSVWLATRGGLDRLDPRSGAVTRYSTEQGLPGDRPVGILADRSGDLWVSFDMAGLARFKTDNAETRVFGTHDGLQGDRFLPGSHVLTQSGELVFGGGERSQSF